MVAKKPTTGRRLVAFDTKVWSELVAQGLETPLRRLASKARITAVAALPSVLLELLRTPSEPTLLRVGASRAKAYLTVLLTEDLRGDIEEAQASHDATCPRHITRP